MSELRGRTAIVTGAGRGLGRSMAAALAGQGVDLVAAGRTAADLESLAAEHPGRVIPQVTDVTDAEAVNRLVETTVERLGRIDIVVNNSGVIASVPLVEQDPESFDRIMATNVRGVYLVTRAAGPHLIAQGAGKVINIASNFALQGVANHVAYSASKAAVIALTRSLAVEWAPHNIQVNAIAPGYFTTDMNAELRADDDLTGRVLRQIPARRMGDPAELNAWLLLLAGGASDFMTGETIVIDGGQAAR